MLIERKWKKWVYFYAPMAVFIVFTLFPFYWMAITAFRPDEELYATWRQPMRAAVDARADARAHEGPPADHRVPTWLWNTMLIATVSTIISLICGTFAGYALARLRFQDQFLGTAIFITYLVPQTLLFIPLADIIRDMQLGNTPWALMLTYPDDPDPVLHLALDGLLQDHPEGARGVRAHRRCDAFRRHGAHHLPVAVPGILSAGIFAFTLSWNEFIYALVFMASADQKTVPVGVVSSSSAAISSSGAN